MELDVSLVGKGLQVEGDLDMKSYEETAWDFQFARRQRVKAYRGDEGTTIIRRKKTVKVGSVAEAEVKACVGQDLHLTRNLRRYSYLPGSEAAWLTWM